MNREEIYNEVIQDYSHLQYEYDGDELQDKINEIVNNIINEIWKYVKHTHNNKDFEDLKTFDVNELKEILEDCKNNK